MTPISASMRNAVIAGRRPEITKAISVSPASVVNQGPSMRNACSGSRRCTRMKLPIGSVMWKTNDVGSCT